MPTGRVMCSYLSKPPQWDTLGHVGSTFDVNGDGKPVICYCEESDFGGAVRLQCLTFRDPTLTDNGYLADKHIILPSGRKGGAKALGVQNLAEHPIQGRAVLFDLFRHYGPGVVVGMAELREIMKKDNIEVKHGDFVLFHTGFGQMLMDAKGDVSAELWENTLAGLDGRDPELLEWITESGVVALISDNVGCEP